MCAVEVPRTLRRLPALTLAQRQARPVQGFQSTFEFSGNRENTSPSASNGYGGYNEDHEYYGYRMPI